MDTLEFEPTIKTKAVVVKSAVDKQRDTVIMIAEIGPGESGRRVISTPASRKSTLLWKE
jgi:hypothetical protein